MAASVTRLSPIESGKAARGIGLVLLELVVLGYLIMLVRGDWPPGHPWTALGGGLGVAAVLTADPRLAAVLALVGVVVCGGAMLL